MILTFYDRQNVESAANGTRVETDEQLQALLDRLKMRAPFFCEFVGESGYNLLVGIGGNIGCVQFSQSDGNPPYLMAVAPKSSNKSGIVEFLMANSATQVPARYCIPFNLLKSIILHFQRTGTRDPTVDWEEI